MVTGVIGNGFLLLLVLYLGERGYLQLHVLYHELTSRPKLRKLENTEPCKSECMLSYLGQATDLLKVELVCSI